MKPAYQKTKEEIFQDCRSSQSGLSSEEVEKRRQEYGYNELIEGQKKSVFVIFLEQFKDFLVLILIAAAAVSIVLNDIESAAVILAVIIMNAILGTVQQIKAEHSLASLKQISTPTAKVLRDGKRVVISSREVTVGDIVFLEAGDSVCADGRIIENASLKINESALTGESLNVEKEDRTIEDEVPLGDRKNMVYSGSFVTYGRGSFLVTGIGMETEVGKIASLLKSTSEKRTPLQENLDDFGKKLAVLILVICAVVFGLNVLRGGQIMDALLFAVALAVAAIPEALSSIVTIVLAFSTQKMVREHAIIRKLQAVEGLGSVSIICSDKTGTLTQNKMTVQKCFADGVVLEDSAVQFDNAVTRKLLDAAVLCSDAEISDGKEIGDPTETALIAMAERHGQDWRVMRQDMPRVAEIPFDSDRKLMSTVNRCADGFVFFTKGAVDVILGRTESILSGSGSRPITEQDCQAIRDANQRFSENGLRVLAFAYKEGHAEMKGALDTSEENGLTFIGLIAMMDPPRLESKDAVAKCVQAGIRPIMITGDHKVTASAIAKEIGILQPGTRAVEGAEIDALSDEALRELVPEISVYARVSPEHKIRIVRAWQDRGNIVSMTGDGVNDAPALKQADIGVAMGITGTEVAKDAASMVLTDDNFATIVKAVENGRNVYGNIKKSIKFLLSGNTAGILSVLYASIIALPVPFAAVHLLFINLLTDSLPAISLGLDPHSSEVMQEKPRPKNEPILTKDFMVGLLIEGAIIALNTMIAFHVGLHYGAGMAAGAATVGSTMAFATLCLSRLMHGFNSKADHPVLFRKEMFNNRYLNLSFLVGFALLSAVLLLPPLEPLFKVATLTPMLYGVIIGCAAMNVVEIQVIKAIRTHLKKKR